MKKSVVVCGKGSLAIKIANWFLKSSQYRLLFVVPVVPEPNWTDSLMQWAKKKKISIITTGNYKDLFDLLETDHKIDLVVSVFYDKIINQRFIDKCKKIINIHNAPLPKYRGVSPINWALKNKEKKHGVTIHEMTRGIDDGPIISQLEYSIYPEFDEVEDVYKRALEYAWILFEQTMPLINKISPTNQNEKIASYYSKQQNKLLGSRSQFTRKQTKGA